jgi:hypothetical protein
MTTKTTVHSLTANAKRDELKTMRAELAKGYDRILELRIEATEAEIERLERAHKYAVDRQAKQDAEEAARTKRQREELERTLMDDYRKRAPGTTEAEAKAALPDLLHRHRLKEQDRMDAELAEARRRIGSLI